MFTVIRPLVWGYGDGGPERMRLRLLDGRLYHPNGVRSCFFWDVSALAVRTFHPDLEVICLF